MPDPTVCRAICRHQTGIIHDLANRRHPLPRLSRFPIPPGQQAPSQVELIISCLHQMPTLRNLPHLPPMCKALVALTRIGPHITAHPQSTSGIVALAVIPTFPHTVQSCARIARTRNAPNAPQHLTCTCLGLFEREGLSRTNHFLAIILDPKLSRRC